MAVDDLPKMTESGMAEQARALIEQSNLARMRRQRQEWLQKNAPPPPLIPHVIIRSPRIA